LGGAHEFPCCWALDGEPFHTPPPGSLYHRPLADELGITAEDFAITSPILMDAVPHLPGQTPASIGLFDEAGGALFSGDVVYDDILIDDCVGSDVGKYRDSMQRLIDLDVTVVHPGHGDSFDGARLREIASAYLERVVSH
jgi:glyoxylase-like metal-dependent hydrolase (beta-lactamase superfamily II)